MALELLSQIDDADSLQNLFKASKYLQYKYESLWAAKINKQTVEHLRKISNDDGECLISWAYIELTLEKHCLARSAWEVSDTAFQRAHMPPPEEGPLQLDDYEKAIWSYRNQIEWRFSTRVAVTDEPILDFKTCYVLLTIQYIQGFDVLDKDDRKKYRKYDCEIPYGKFTYPVRDTIKDFKDCPRILHRFTEVGEGQYFDVLGTRSDYPFNMEKQAQTGDEWFWYRDALEGDI